MSSRLKRRIERLEYLVESWRVDHFRRVVETCKSLDRELLYANERSFIMKHGYVPRTLGYEAIFHQLKMFVKEAPAPEHPAWDGIDDLLWYVEPGKKSRWDPYAWPNVWRFIKLYRRMPVRKHAVRSDKWRWLRRELAGLRLHMGEQTFDPKAELRSLKQQPGRLVRAVMEDSQPPSEVRRMATRDARVERRRARRRIERETVLARKAVIRKALGKPPAVPILPDDDARLFGGGWRWHRCTVAPLGRHCETGGARRGNPEPARPAGWIAASGSALLAMTKTDGAPGRWIAD